jgi:hypothetical protein
MDPTGAALKDRLSPQLYVYAHAELPLLDAARASARRQQTN